MTQSIYKSVLDKVANWLDRRELSQLRKRIISMENEKADFAPKLAYLESRDKLCSSMANTINKQAFEIAKMRGDYDKKTIAQ